MLTPLVCSYNVPSGVRNDVFVIQILSNSSNISLGIFGGYIVGWLHTLSRIISKTVLTYSNNLSYVSYIQSSLTIYSNSILLKTR